MIIQRIRDKHALEIANKKLSKVGKKQYDFLKKNLETSVISNHPEKVVNDEIAFKKRIGRVERNKMSDLEFAKKIEKYLGK